ncbi:MAG: ABC transporter permease subunit [Nocardioides sp.]
MHDIGDYIQVNHGVIGTALLQHLRLSLIPVLVAVVLAVPVGWIATIHVALRHTLFTAGNILYTVPSLAMFLVLPGLLGTSILDETNVIVALAIYTLALLVPRVAEGLNSVDPLVLQAATAMGYKPVRRWATVQLPLALPVVFAAVRVATVANVSLVTVASLIGIGGLGGLFTRGFQLGFYAPPIVIGLVLCVGLAIVLDLLIVALQRLVTPWVRA